MAMTENPVVVDVIVMPSVLILERVRLGYSGIRIYSGMYSGYSAPWSSWEQNSQNGNPGIPK